jgi:hypothetical protein
MSLSLAPKRIAEKRIANSRGLSAVVLVDAHALVRIIGVGAAPRETNRSGRNRIATLSLPQNKFETGFPTARQILVYQLRAVRAELRE